MGMKDIRESLTPAVNAVLEDMIDTDVWDEIDKPEHYNS